MKKLVAILAAACLSASLLAGCGSDEPKRSDAPPPSSASSASASSSSSSSQTASSSLIEKTWANGVEIDEYVKGETSLFDRKPAEFNTVNTEKALYDTAIDQVFNQSTWQNDYPSTGEVIVTVPFYNRYNKALSADELIEITVTDPTGKKLENTLTYIATPTGAVSEIGVDLIDIYGTMGAMDKELGWSWGHVNDVTMLDLGTVVGVDEKIKPASEWLDNRGAISNWVNYNMALAKFAIADPSLDDPAGYTVTVKDLVSGETFEIENVMYPRERTN